MRGAGPTALNKAKSYRAGGNGGYLFVKFDGKGPKGGSFYDVDSKPTGKYYSVDKENIMSVDRRYGKLVFKNPGKAIVTIKLGDYSKSILFHIVEISISPNSSRDEVVKALGFPGNKKKGVVAWPKSEIIDGVSYSPGLTHTRFVQYIGYEHWRYQKYPGLVLAWSQGELNVLTRP